jgi:hypothetical protein
MVHLFCLYAECILTGLYEVHLPLRECLNDVQLTVALYWLKLESINEECSFLQPKCAGAAAARCLGHSSQGLTLNIYNVV